ncbi:MAG: T9SS type A sorting domain-containing protein [Saprospiraceae bacterium]|nr:T9SS type A sorting domain-containing protein [Candidatus Defluviibacterium haderslevense]
MIAPIEDYNGNLFEITNRSIGAIEYQKVSNNDDLNTSSMLVYPNPSKGLIHIISDLIKGEHLKITIFSIQGNFIKSIPINTTTNPSIDLQMNDGTYMYIIEDSKEKILKRSLLLISK